MIVIVIYDDDDGGDDGSCFIIGEEDVSRPNADARDERDRRNNGTSSHEESQRDDGMKMSDAAR